jgi:hypothetical protein
MCRDLPERAKDCHKDGGGVVGWGMWEYKLSVAMGWRGNKPPLAEGLGAGKIKRVN